MIDTVARLVARGRLGAPAGDPAHRNQAGARISREACAQTEAIVIEPARRGSR